MGNLQDYYTARDFMVKALTDDLMGSEADDVIHEPPLNRFVVGVLYPQDPDGLPLDESVVADDDMESAECSDDSAVDPPVALSHVRQPSSCGMTVSVPESAESVTVDVTAGRYEETVEGQWNRIGVSASCVVSMSGTSTTIDIAPGLQLRVIVRPARQMSRAITIAMVNTQLRPQKSKADHLAWFQPTLMARCDGGFLDRPTHRPGTLADADVASNDLLFRNARNLAVGHGCAAEWDDADLSRVWISFIPHHDVHLADASIDGVRLDMGTLAAHDRWPEIENMITLYEDWISERTLEAATLDERFASTAHEHLAAACDAASRMRGGLDYLYRHDDARLAFKLMNEAMLRQRNAQDKIRNGSSDHTQSWRPFQLAFVIMNIEALAEPSSSDRDVADLLWFPTGGGKTEAYLGLIAFSILLRRVRDPRAGGVSVIMRYTLRLLTTQQFERAAGLICSLEALRLNFPRHSIAGETPGVTAGVTQTLEQSRRYLNESSAAISVGLWVGQAITPNDADEARRSLQRLSEGKQLDEKNPVQLEQCPWCGHVLTHENYSVENSRLIIRCPDDGCQFCSGLPVHVIDSDIYMARPSLLLATVDKFAMMAWKGEVQTLFSMDGNNPSPDLIVQDELHLISGPLGTMVGLYESAVDAACSRNGRPKLIASTATIRRATEQVRSVFDRTTRQFPPPCLDEADSFFSVTASADSKGTRQYVGVMAPGSTHTYLMVRTYAALLQAGLQLQAPEEVRDTYWTLVGYFNSLRVLGGAYIQVTDDVPAHIGVISNRTSTVARSLSGPPEEITSHVPSSQVRPLLTKLGKTRSDDDCADVVLATNMISVGLDVDRLGLMAVMGQPQTNAEYIQATSRVGRQHPGLVVVIYNSTRSRDLSYYESFATHHRALYRDMESNSATPFSPRARDRGLHGALVSYARMTVPDLNPSASVSRAKQMRATLDGIVDHLLDRVSRIDADQRIPTARQLESLLEAWTGTEGLSAYEGWFPSARHTLLTQASTMAGQQIFPVKDPPWATLTSLRDVDADTGLYLYRKSTGEQQ